MTRHNNTRVIILLLMAVLTIIGCSNKQKESAGIYDYLETEGFTSADSIVNDASDSRDYHYMLRVIDSLNNAGQLSKPKYIFYRTITLNLLNQQNESFKLYYQLDTLDLKELKSETDIESYVYSYNNYIRILCDMRRYDRALREVNKADQRLKRVGYTTFTEHHDICQIIGESQLYLDQTDSARVSFERSLQGIHKRLTNHHDPLDLRECQKTMNAISKAYSRKGMFAEAETWLRRQDSIYAIADKSEKRDTVYLDEMSAEINYSRAILFIKQGKKKEAQQAYDRYINTNTAHQLTNIINDNEYLMLSERYAEAARRFERLDEYLLINGYKCDLENIGRYMMPKFSANMMAGRRDSALHVASTVAYHYNRALADQKINDANLLTMVYDTEGKERQIAEKSAELSQQRMVMTLISLAITILLFHIYSIMRRRNYRKLDEANKQLKEANLRAEESQRMKAKFIHQISHEVRTPLNVLSGFTQVLASPDIEISSKELKSISEKIVKNSERITQLVDKMLELSLINSDAPIECNDKTKPADVAYEAAHLTGINHAEHLNFRLNIDDNAKSVYIKTNLKAAVKALSLLLDNAMKFTHPLAYKDHKAPEGKASVELTVEVDGENIMFAVKDTGIGIPPEQAENIFTEFVQLDEYTDGTGIGLSIARSLAQHLGGNIILDTDYTGGARFLMTLPNK